MDLAEPRLESAQPGIYRSERRAVDAGIAVGIAGLTKRYGAIVALSGVSFEVQVGEIFGLLGPNGAGKTTLIEILAGLREADGGSVVALGVDLRGDRAPLRERLGVALQRSALPPFMTVGETLRFYAALYRAPVSPADLIDRLQLGEIRDRQIRRLSDGQQQRVAIGVALVGDPQLMLLDEPTGDLDPHAAAVIWQVLIAARARRTIILSTHHMEEATRMCSRVAVVDHGTVLALDTPAALIERYSPGHVIAFRTDAGAPLDGLDAIATPVPDDPREVRVTIRAEQLDAALDRLLARRRVGGLRVDHLAIEPGTLGDVFLHLTGRSIRS